MIHPWAIPSETTQFLAKKIMVLIFFSVKYTSLGPIRVHNPEYQPPLTSESNSIYKFRQLSKTGHLQLDITFFYILLRCNQNSQEADIQDYELS